MATEGLKNMRGEGGVEGHSKEHIAFYNYKNLRGPVCPHVSNPVPPALFRILSGCLLGTPGLIINLSSPLISQDQLSLYGVE